MYVCICKAITTNDVRRAGRAGLLTPERLVAQFGLDDSACCGRCVQRVEQFVELAWEGAGQASYAGPGASQPLPSLAGT